jgi:hypothetical protein
VRIGPGGVEANLASPTWFLTNQPFGADGPPAGAVPGAAPRWAAVAAEPAWGWFDHRLHPEPVGPVLGEERVATFEVPMRLGEEAVVVRGHLEARTELPAFGAVLRRALPAEVGLVAQVAPGRAPGLFRRYEGTGQVVVTGADGEPFLRLGDEGAAVNLRSPTWQLSAQASGAELGDLPADPAAPPEWSSVSSSPSYSWIDPRALIAEVGDEPVTLDWSIPVTLADGSLVEIEGRSTAELTPLPSPGVPRPEPARDRRPGWLLPAVVLGAVATVAVVARLARPSTSARR